MTQEKTHLKKDKMIPSLGKLCCNLCRQRVLRLLGWHLPRRGIGGCVVIVSPARCWIDHRRPIWGERSRSSGLVETVDRMCRRHWLGITRWLLRLSVTSRLNMLWLRNTHCLHLVHTLLRFGLAATIIDAGADTATDATEEDDKYNHTSHCSVIVIWATIVVVALAITCWKATAIELLEQDAGI